MKTLKIAILVARAAPIILLAGCSSVTVTTDYDHTAPFASYRTYALEPPPKGPTLSPLADSALRDSLRSNLAARGIREVAITERPDLAVVSHVVLQQQYSVQQYNQWGYGYGAWPYSAGYYGMWVGAPTAYTTVSSYTEGTLILDFVDPSKQRLVFRGVGKATVGSAESNAKKIQEAVTKIVQKLPIATQP